MAATDPQRNGEGAAPGWLSVSRETAARLRAHLVLVARWQRAVNLVAPASLAQGWERHVLDSAQLAEHLPAGARRLVDLGSGAGFPGLVLAILGVPAVDLIESDRRKAAFLREAARELGLGGVTVHAERIERVVPFATDIVTARALAPLPRLLELARPFVAPRTRCLFLKGRGAAAELTAARAAWTMRAAVVPSRTATDGVLLILDEVQRAERRSASEPHPDPGARQPEGRGR